MMNQKRPLISNLAVLILLAGGVMLAMTRSQAGDVEDRITPAVEVINFGNIGIGLGRFETSTGAIWRYNGDIRESSGHGQWIAAVKGVDHRASGTFRIQQAGVVTFLVDAADGRTWILRKRASNWKWEEVKQFN